MNISEEAKAAYDKRQAARQVQIEELELARLRVMHEAEVFRRDHIIGLSPSLHDRRRSYDYEIKVTALRRDAQKVRLDVAKDAADPEGKNHGGQKVGKDTPRTKLDIKRLLHYLNAEIGSVMPHCYGTIPVSMLQNEGSLEQIAPTALHLEAVRRGFQAVKSFTPGSHCRRFWDPASDNDSGCYITPFGVLVFTGHDKPYMTWRDIFGDEFVQAHARTHKMTAKGAKPL